MICLVQASDMGWCLKMQLFVVFAHVANSRHPVIQAPATEFSN
jgi:hypothetical protein